MHGAGHFAAASLLSFGLACATPVDVKIEQRSELARFCTWDFLPLGSGGVQAPHSDSHALNAAVARLVEKGLLERGLARVTDRPDVFVTYFLGVEREVAVVAETPAMEHLSSLHHTPSYDIQATEKRVEVHEEASLTLLVSDPEQQAVVWRGSLEGRFRGEMSSHLEDAVSKLLDRLPTPVAAHGARSDAGTKRRAAPSWDCAVRG